MPKAQVISPESSAKKVPHSIYYTVNILHNQSKSSIYNQSKSSIYYIVNILHNQSKSRQVPKVPINPNQGKCPKYPPSIYYTINPNQGKCQKYQSIQIKTSAKSTLTNYPSIKQKSTTFHLLNNIYYTVNILHKPHYNQNSHPL